MANLFLTGSGVPTLAVGEATDYYRDAETNLIYYRASAGWEAVPSLIPTPDGVGTNWLFGTGAPDNGVGATNDYYRDDDNGTIYRKHPVNGWEAKGSLDFIGVYGVQWGEGLGAPANTEPLNNLPAGSFYLDVLTSDIYYKNNTLTWALKGQLGGGGGGGSSINVVNNLLSTSATDALSANMGNFIAISMGNAIDTLNDAISATNDNAQNYALDAENNAKSYADSVVTSTYKFQGTYDPQETDNFPTDLNTLGEVPILAGFTWVVSGVTGQYTFQGVTVDNGDTLLALVDNPSATNAEHWHITEKNLGYTPENQNNKATSLTSPDNTKYPTTQAVVNGLLANLDATVNTCALTTYTLQAVDNDGKTYLRMTSASANTVTIPSTQTKPISISQRGVGATTLEAGAGVTLNGILTFDAQHQTKTVIPLGSNVFDVVG